MFNQILKFITVSLLISSAHFSSLGQSIEGRWEGIMADEILQVNIVQKGKSACGYSYDFLIDNPANSCKAYFSGTFDAKEGFWRLKGYRFIENSGSHVLMVMNLRYEKENGKPALKGYVTAKNSPENPSAAAERAVVELKREFISKSDLNSIRNICFPAEEAPGLSNVQKKKNAPDSSTAKSEQVKTLKAPVGNQKITPGEKTGTEISINKKLELPSDVLSRKRNEVSRIPVTTRSIKLRVFDNGIVDNDTVTIYYNKKLLISKQKLSDKAIEIDLELDENEKLHEIIMYAENLGSIPPNTALIVVNAGDKRYELFSSASMEENAILIFEYQKAMN